MVVSFDYLSIIAGRSRVSAPGGRFSNWSATDHGHSRQTLLENGVNDRLNALGGADAYYAYIPLKSILGAF